MIYTYMLVSSLIHRVFYQIIIDFLNKFVLNINFLIRIVFLLLISFCRLFRNLIIYKKYRVIYQFKF
jgi:hypothetical protein